MAECPQARAQMQCYRQSCVQRKQENEAWIVAVASTISLGLLVRERLASRWARHAILGGAVLASFKGVGLAMDITELEIKARARPLDLDPYGETVELGLPWYRLHVRRPALMCDQSTFHWDCFFHPPTVSSNFRGQAGKSLQQWLRENPVSV
jgi:hypothetical protein